MLHMREPLHQLLQLQPKFVVMNITAIDPSFPETVEPALNPNHPNQRIKHLMPLNTTE